MGNILPNKEDDFTAICRCAYCGEIIDFCTRDNPCSKCGNTIFKVEYRPKSSQ